MAVKKLDTDSVEVKSVVELGSKIPVRLAYLHQSILVPGVIGNEKTLSKAKMRDLQMFWAPIGLILERKATRAIVPHANVACAIIDE